MALRRDPKWVDLAEDDYDSDLEWYESDWVLDTLRKLGIKTLKGSTAFRRNRPRTWGNAHVLRNYVEEEVRNALPRPVKIQRNSKVTLKEQRIRIRKEDGTQTLERCGLLCSLKKPKLEYWT